MSPKLTLTVIGIVIAALTSDRARADTRYPEPAVYRASGIEILTREARLGWDGKFWLKAILTNQTGKELVVDLNSLEARLPDASLRPREVGVSAPRGRSPTTPPRRARSRTDAWSS
jgi:hypothetical protein